jgi:hypothetical protein
MAMDEDFVWLHHPDTDGYFRCPAAAVKAWVGRGWEPADEPPPEQDKTRDEPMLAALREALAAEQAPAEPADEPGEPEEKNAKPTTASRRSAAATEVKE